MKVEIFKEDAVIIEESRGEKKFYSQKAYLHKSGSRFPLEFKLSRKKSDHPYPAGMYQIDDTSYRINNYGKLELNPFEIALVRNTAEVPIKQTA